ncbi:MAG: flippase-like domain-containing protein [Acidobacteria bacterium]|nr:flippase-like domain-containing protein [Acidobacteriota bacterium]
MLTLLAGAAGAALLVGLIVYAGPARLAAHLRTLGPVLPLLLALTGVRYLLQAAGWRLAIAPADRPGWAPFVNAVVVGEAVGYVAWGPITREPAKALFLSPVVPARVALIAALVERGIFVVTATALAVVAAGLLATRHGLFIWLAAAAAVAVTLAMTRRVRRAPRADRLGSKATLDVARDLWSRRPAALLGIGGLALAQEAINVLEAYLIFTWLGAAPTLMLALLFEGLSRVVNAVGQFVPGRVGVYEAASALLADALSLGASYGVSLALARRARSLLWAVPGGVLLMHRGYRRATRSAGRETVVPALLESRP